MCMNSVRTARTGIWDTYLTDEMTSAMQPPFNISLYPGTGTMDGRRGDHVLLAPAYNVTEEDVRYIVDTTAAAITLYFKTYVNQRGAKEEDGKLENDGIDGTA